MGDAANEYETIEYDVAPDKVATITLNRPEVLNAFDRTMCHEVADAWRRVKDDPAVNAVVLRAAGDRAFSTGLDTSKPYGQPDDVWNHEDPGELLSPDGANINSRPGNRHKSLITIRPHFIPQMINMANDV